MDKHHVAGKTNSPVTVQVPVNDHRARHSVAQYEWPPDTLTNPHKCPLRRIAAYIRGFIDHTLYLIEALLTGAAVLLEQLSEALWERLGPGWWQDMFSTNTQESEHSNANQ